MAETLPQGGNRLPAAVYRMHTTNLRDKADVAGEGEVPATIARFDLVDLALAWSKRGEGRCCGHNTHQQTTRHKGSRGFREVYDEQFPLMPRTGYPSGTRLPTLCIPPLFHPP